MFDLIDALEALGADADLVSVSSVRLDAILQAKGADPALRSALLEGDARKVEILLHAPMNLCPFIHPAEEEEEPEEEEEEDEGDDDGDDDEHDVNPRKGPKPLAS